MSSYNDATAKTADGQDLRITLQGGYTVSFNAHHTGNDASRAVESRTMSSGPAPSQLYGDAPGKPRLYTQQGTKSATDTVTLRDIVVTDSLGSVVTGYAFVGVDAEYTDAPGSGPAGNGGESIGWDSNVPVDVYDNSAGGGCPANPTGAGTTNVSCDGVASNGRTLVTRAISPTSFSTSVHSSIAEESQGFAFAVQFAKLTTIKEVSGRAVSTDAFDVATTSPTGSTMGSASTGPSDAATTGATTVMPTGQAYTLAESASSGSGTNLDNYAKSWVCTNAANNSSTSLPNGSGTSVQVTPQAGDDITCTITNTSRTFEVTKVADKTTASPGDVVKYTVTITNTGNADFTETTPASFTDDLSSVLDDATYNNDQSASAGTATYSRPKLAWSGPIASGASVTVGYSVTVNNPDTGDKVLTNVVTGGSGCVGSCEATTNTPVRTYTVSKAVDKAVAKPGEKVTYTVTVTNTGKAPYTEEEPVSFTDDLSKVTDDATYNGDASDGATVRGDTLSWSGSLAMGKTVTITYSFTVNDPDTGDRKLDNAVVPTGPGGGCATADGCTTHTVVTVPPGPSVATGGTAITVPPVWPWLSLGGLALLLAGAGAYGLRRTGRDGLQGIVRD